MPTAALVVGSSRLPLGPLSGLARPEPLRPRRRRSCDGERLLGERRDGEPAVASGAIGLTMVHGKRELGSCFDQLRMLPFHTCGTYAGRDVWKGGQLVQRGAVLTNLYGFGGSRGVSREEIMTGAYGLEMAQAEFDRKMMEDELGRLGNDLGFDDVDVDDDDFGYDFSNQGRHDWAPSAPAVAGGARA